MKLKVAIALMLCLVMLTGVIAGCASTTPAAEASATEAVAAEATAAPEATAAETAAPLKIGVVFADFGNTAYAKMGEAMKDEAAKYGAEVTLKDTGGDAATLVDVIENFIVAGCNVIIEQNSSQDVTADVNKEALDKGIILLSFDEEMDNATVSYVANNYDLGKMIGTMAGQWITSALGGEAQVGIFTARSYDFILDRQAGIEDGLKETAPNAKIVIYADTVTAEDGVTQAENFLQAYPDINCICGINDSVILGAYEAFKAAGKVGDTIGLFACDGTDDAIAAVAEMSIHRGTISMSLTDVGREMIDDAATLVGGGTVTDTVKYFPMQMITQDNVSEFLK